MIIFAAFGIIASIFQLAILREFNFSIAKNELSFVVAAGFWIVFCSLGSQLKIGKRLRMLPTLFSVIFSLSIYLIHSAKSLAGLQYYEAASFWFVLGLSIIAVGPVALATGAIFRQLVDSYIESNPVDNRISASFFAFEAFGFFLGGMIFTFFLNGYANPLFFSVLPLLLLPAINKPAQKIIAAASVAAVSIVSMVFFYPLIQKELGAQVLFNLGSAYGPVVAAQKQQTKLLFSAGSLLATSEDGLANEEFIHMSLSALKPDGAKKSILFIGAAVFGRLEEIIKHQPDEIDCLQINPLISQLARLSAPEGNKVKIDFISLDPRIYLKNTHKKYDTILMSMPAPANLGLNRYFTQEFFKSASAKLKPKGIFAFAIPSKREILSPQFARFNSSIINAVKRVFKYNFIIPQDTMIVLASAEQEISNSYLLENFQKSNLETSFLTIYHFRDFLAPGVRNYTLRMLDNDAPANTDQNLAGFLNYVILEQAKFFPGLKIDTAKTRKVITIFLLLAAGIVGLIGFWSKKAFSLFNVALIGFNSISLMSVIFVLFQTYCGSLFWKLGMLVALVMAGLAIGAFFLNRLKSYRSNLLSIIYFIWMFTVFILYISLPAIQAIDWAELVFYALALACGLLTGAAYPCLAQNLLKYKFENKKLAPIIYSLDLAGAFLGTLACGIFLIPFLGASNTLLSLILLNAILALLN